MQIKARRLNRCNYPPIGKYSYPQGAKIKNFESVEIPKSSVGRLRPDGAKQSQAEARILMNIVAIQQNRAPINGDILSR